MFNLDEGVELYSPGINDNNSIFDLHSLDNNSKRISLAGIDSLRQSVSIKNQSQRDSLPLNLNLNQSIFFPQEGSVVNLNVRGEEHSTHSKGAYSSLNTHETNLKSPRRLKCHPITKQEKKIKKASKKTSPKFRSPKKVKAIQSKKAKPEIINEKPKTFPKTKTFIGKGKCTCKKTKCLKLYCECFAKTGFCGPKCKCKDCHNRESLQDLRQIIIQETIEKNPLAFASKYKKIEEKNIKKLHSRGCNCKKTSCVKNYCECFNAGIGCSKLCHCSDCKNDCFDLSKAELMVYHDKVLRKRKRRNYLYDFYFEKRQKQEN